MQWHVHDNLCFTDDPVAPQVAGLTRPDGTCRAAAGQTRESPMIHVWITPNACGPFAALEGVGAGDPRGRGALVRPRPRLVTARSTSAAEPTDGTPAGVENDGL